MSRSHFHFPVVAQGALPRLRLGVDLLVLVEGVQRVAHLAAELALLLRPVVHVDHGAVLPQPLLVGKGLAALRKGYTNIPWLYLIHFI